MVSKLEQCCFFVDSFKQVTWTRMTMLICMTPFALLLLLFVILFLLFAENPGAVVSNSLVCSSVGGQVLDEGGSAVDAAIATMLCEGVALPNSAGIGGGFTAIMFANGRFDSIVATPTVPSAVQNITDFDESYDEGARAVGVPGELMGYWEMHKRYGVLSWRRLFEPAIELCEKGVPITEWLAGVFRYHKERIVGSKTMGAIFDFNVGDTEKFVAEHRIRFPKLAETLKIIAREGVKPFYKGRIGDEFIKDIQRTEYGIEGNVKPGIMVKKDLEEYEVLWDSKPPSLNLKHDFKLYTTPLPTSGALIVFIMNIIKNFDLNDYRLFWHRYIEATKHAFGRSALLGDAVHDPEYRESIMQVYDQMLDDDFVRKIRELIKDDSVFADPTYYGSSYIPRYTNGSANICVLSPKGDAVAATTSLMSEFGAFFASENTGIIANNLLARFKYHKLKQYRASPTNRPLPGKHAFSPYCPTIVMRRKTSAPFFIVGASGGPRASTLVSTALIKYVLNATSASESVDFRYLHNQLYPNRVEYEEEPYGGIVDYLKKVGHEVFPTDATFDNFTAVTCIGKRFDSPDASFDKRVGGSVSLVNAKSDLYIVLVILIVGLATSIVGLLLYDVLNTKTSLVFWAWTSDQYQQTEA